jgi:hypothetical protein
MHFAQKRLATPDVHIYGKFMTVVVTQPACYMKYKSSILSGEFLRSYFVCLQTSVEPESSSEIYGERRVWTRWGELVLTLISSEHFSTRQLIRSSSSKIGSTIPRADVESALHNTYWNALYYACHSRCLIWNFRRSRQTKLNCLHLFVCKRELHLF